MTLILPLEQVDPAATGLVGGKAAALARLQQLGHRVPDSLVISTAAYRQYLQTTGLDALLLMELGRKDFAEMRWEELWDAALRIRNLFLTTELPPALAAEIASALAVRFDEQPLAIRSSAPGEDAGRSSFAGLHSSYVALSDRAEQLRAVRKVWASLWSDRALLYRQELQLEIASSSMAVLVQELVIGEKSGVAFSRSPSNAGELAIEAVWGLNQGLVDGSIEPDHWALDREQQHLSSFRAAERHSKLIPGPAGPLSVPTSATEQAEPPLSETELTTVAALALELEAALGPPQDLEWTWLGEQLVLLQARPITTGSEPEDPRRWYLSLHRNLENLQSLQQRIESELLPGMEKAAGKLAEVALEELSDQQLAVEIYHRRKIQKHWEEAYRSDCIPMAHGIRLFGEFYNDALRPQDPFAFLALLRGPGLQAVKRNRQLAELAEQLRDGQQPATEEIAAAAAKINLPVDLTSQLLQEMARQPLGTAVVADRDLEAEYLAHFPVAEREQAAEILAIGRASYRLRDDDNLSLDLLNRQVRRAEQLAEQRLQTQTSERLRQALDTAAESTLHSPPLGQQTSPLGQLHARQLQGQPASPGLATAPARVIHQQSDLAAFRRGEILVCDAVDPTLTFVVPLAAGIVERRGGMLIHGAIIAREYGIPCVSGITAAADIIHSGDRLTIDGDLGLVFLPSGSGNLVERGMNSPNRKELDDAAEP